MDKANFLSSNAANPAFAKYAWMVLAYNLFVILWGAFVRATGSGAGCGSHWPLCNGDVVPRAPELATIIEFTHRATSGIALIAVVGLVVWAYRAYPKGSLVRMGAVLSGIFILTEALIGAGLVLLEHVAQNASIGRGYSLSIHLLNTFILIAMLALTAWWASGGPAPDFRQKGGLRWLLAASLAGLMVVGVSGAIAALGDTLFPASSLGEGMRDDLSSTAHIFVRLRVFHPFLAVGGAALLLWVVMRAMTERKSPLTKTLGLTVMGLAFGQVLLGVVNLALLAPVWMQLVHLLFADLLWIASVLFAAAALSLESGVSASPTVRRSAATLP
jgi:heme a synthase